ncbi:hypothetical protein [Aquimarina litoralis]|uniref:hypothetical protein n=1 Tax=Aquimarina litoralis TaxID=584605 RepID=UPI001C5661BB|nr:hypothetical protein [Aquimarina litoralis]MBW1295192.1 hypothetical protein [Aquimarina litoralis]
MLFVLGLMQNVHAQFIEIVDTNVNVETDVKNDFVLLCDKADDQVAKGIEQAGIKQKENELILKSKPISVVMYWRYDLVSDRKQYEKYVARLESYTSKQEMTDLGKKLVTLGLINTIIE